MNRRDCLKALLALGVTLALPALDIASASKVEIVASEPLPHSEHPRIASLRREVLALEASEEQKKSLLKNVDVFREKFTAGHVNYLKCYHRDGSVTHVEASDLELLINHTPGMAMEMALYQMGQRMDMEASNVSA